MRIGFHAPLPPARSGVADYAAALLALLRRRGEVLVNSRRAADVELYHLGNNQLHRPIYFRALERPGLVVLHDALLHHFFLGSLDEAAYIDEFVYNYGEWGGELAHGLWRNRARSAQDPRYFRYRMLRRIAERSLGVVTHNPAATAAVREHAPGARVFEIPHLFQPPRLPAPYAVIRLRAGLGLPGGAVLFGVFGHLRESKRLPSILRAIERLRGAGKNVSLLLAGAFASSDLERAVAPWLRRPAVVATGYAPERAFWAYASAVDVCINLRYPSAGESSGIAIRLMGIGKPAILTAGDETARFPEAACVRIDAGVAEQAMLEEAMAWLVGSAWARADIGRLAASHIAAEHDAGRCADLYWDALRVCAGARGVRPSA
ncbi:MAG: glycosyltransferase [Bryobacteraceae bacterium]|nr:glycosyltransferase [Bryobacteraceae bacterium]